MAVAWAVIVFKNSFAEAPILNVFWVRAFWAKLSKGDFATKKEKTEKFDWWLKSSFFGIFCFLVFLTFCFLLFFFLGGFKGQVRWRKGPPHLALSPPYFLGFFCLVFFFFVLFRRESVFPLKTGIFVCFSWCLPLFPPCFFSLPPFSLSLSLSLSCCFLSSFLPYFFRSCFPVLPCFCLFVCLPCFFAFVSWKQHQIIELERLFSSVLSVVGFPVLLSFYYICFFSWF